MHAHISGKRTWYNLWYTLSTINKPLVEPLSFLTTYVHEIMLRCSHYRGHATRGIPCATDDPYTVTTTEATGNARQWWTNNCIGSQTAIVVRVGRPDTSATRVSGPIDTAGALPL